MLNRVILLIAQGLGLGRLPLAPGTFGTLLGIPWALLLLCGGNLWLYGVGFLVGAAASVWFCTRAEEILDSHDPGSVVIDEIVAMPLAMLPLVLHTGEALHHFPQVGELMTTRGWVGIGLAYALFRLFDIWKPWPVRQSQNLARGLGVTADDILAGAYAALVLAAVYQFGWLK